MSDKTKTIKRIELSLNKKSSFEEMNSGKQKLTMDRLKELALKQGLVREGRFWKKISLTNRRK